MHKHLILFFLALCGLTACINKSRPEDVIEKTKMTRLLFDIHVVDGSLATQVVRDSLYKYGSGRYAQLFKQYGIDSGTFKKSLRYYATQPDELLAIYDDVTKRLNARSAALAILENKAANTASKKLEAKQKLSAKADSLKKQRLKDSIKRDSLNKSALIRSKRLGNQKIK